MKLLLRHKTFIKDMRNVRLTDTQATKLFLYIANLLKNEPLPPESKNHSLILSIVPTLQRCFI
jgi:mRNA interferase YafQ